MAGKKKQQDSRVGEIAEQLEHAFMAGLGALSDAQKKGAERFDDLVREGERFRKMATSAVPSVPDCKLRTEAMFLWLGRTLRSMGNR